MDSRIVKTQWQGEVHVKVCKSGQKTTTLPPFALSFLVLTKYEHDKMLAKETMGIILPDYFSVYSYFKFDDDNDIKYNWSHKLKIHD